MENQTNISDMHAEHRQWQQDLAFYREEMTIFGDRLREVVSKNPPPDVVTWVVHFQNQFVIQNQMIDEILQSVRSHEHEMKQLIEQGTQAVDGRLVGHHAEARGKVQVFSRLYHALKNDLNQFLSKHLVGQAAE
ncbi:MAG: hypothetical protein H7Z75_15975 [Ferruginibacter sp.]|nr:hypothetical protein [Cytophagales bacterium]